MAEVIRYCPKCGKPIRKLNKKYCKESCGRTYRKIEKEKKDGKND